MDLMAVILFSAIAVIGGWIGIKSGIKKAKTMIQGGGVDHALPGAMGAVGAMGMAAGAEGVKYYDKKPVENPDVANGGTNSSTDNAKSSKIRFADNKLLKGAKAAVGMSMKAAKIGAGIAMTGAAPVMVGAQLAGRGAAKLGRTIKKPAQFLGSKVYKWGKHNIYDRGKFYSVLAAEKVKAAIPENTRRKLKAYPILAMEKGKHYTLKAGNTAKVAAEKARNAAKEAAEKAKDVVPEDTRRKIKFYTTLGVEKGKHYAITGAKVAKDAAQKAANMAVAGRDAVKDKMETAALYAMYAADEIKKTAGYKTGERGLTMIAGAVTSGVVLANKLKAPKGTTEAARITQYAVGERARHVTENQAPTQVTVNQPPNIDVALNDHYFNLQQQGPTLVNMTVMQQIKAKEIKQNLKETRGYGFDSRQANRYMNLKREMSQNNNGQFNTGDDIKEYFEPMIKQDPQLKLNTKQMFKVIEQAKAKQGETEKTIENAARMSVDSGINSEQEAKDAIEKVLDDSPELKDRFEELVRENMRDDINNITESKMRELEAKAKQTGKNVEDLKLELQTENEEEATKAVMKEIASHPDGDTAREYLGEEGQKALQDLFKQNREKREEKYRAAKKNYEKMRDDEFVEKNEEYRGRKSYEIRDARRKKEREENIAAATNELYPHLNSENKERYTAVVNKRESAVSNVTPVAEYRTRSRYNYNRGNITGAAG